MKGNTQVTCMGVHATAPAEAFELPVPPQLLAVSRRHRNPHRATSGVRARTQTPNPIE